MDLKDADKKLDQVDGILTKAQKLIWKHKWFLLFLLFSWGCYNFIVMVGEEMDKPVEETYDEWEEEDALWNMTSMNMEILYGIMMENQ